MTLYWSCFSAPFLLWKRKNDLRYEQSFHWPEVIENLPDILLQPTRFESELEENKGIGRDILDSLLAAFRRHFPAWPDDLHRQYKEKFSHWRSGFTSRNWIPFLLEEGLNFRWVSTRLHSRESLTETRTELGRPVNLPKSLTCNGGKTTLAQHLTQLEILEIVSQTLMWQAYAKEAWPENSENFDALIGDPPPAPSQNRSCTTHHARMHESEIGANKVGLLPPFCREICKNEWYAVTFAELFYGDWMDGSVSNGRIYRDTISLRNTLLPYLSSCSQYLVRA